MIRTIAADIMERAVRAVTERLLVFARRGIHTRTADALGGDSRCPKGFTR